MTHRLSRFNCSWVILSYLAGLCIAFEAAGGSAAAQTAGLEAQSAPTRTPLTPMLQGPLQPFFIPPPLEKVQRTPQSYGSSAASFKLKEIHVSKNRLLTPQEIARYTSPYIGTDVTLADLNVLRDQLTDAIVAKGYINSGAVLDSGDLSSGVLSITIVEGRLSKIKVNFCDKAGPCRSNSYLAPTYISERLAVGSNGQPLTTEQLQQAYQLLLEDHNLSHLNARLVPGSAPGEAELDVDASVQPRQSVTAFVTSDRSPAVGDTRAGIDGRFAPSLFPGDELSGEIGHTAGLTDGALTYKAPISPQNLSFQVYAQASHAKILSTPLNALDAVSDNEYYGIGLSIPIYSVPGKSLVLASNIDEMHVQTDMLGARYSFSPGAVNGVTDYMSSRTNLTYTYFSNVSSYIVNMNVTAGLLGASRATGVDKNFVYADLSGSYVIRLNDLNHRLILKGDVRATHGMLYATESFVLGGNESVRGYRQNALIGNEGYWGSAEYQVPLVSLLPPVDTINPMLSPQTVTLGAFLDAGHMNGSVDTSGTKSNLAAFGIHTIWAPVSHFDVDMYFAHQLDHLPYSGSYEDAGFGFAVHARY